MVPLLFAAVALAPSTALAFDVDLWRPGPSSASPGDALTAPSAWTMGAGQTSIRWANLWVPGTLHSVVVPASCEREAVLAGSVEPGTACARDLASIVGQDGSTTVPEDAHLERPLLGPITTTALVVERGLGPNAAVGMRVRGLWSTSPHSEHGEVADIGPLVDGLGQPRITDGSLWAHWSLPLSERLRMGIAPELRLDSDILVGDLPEIPHIGTVSGTGTGVASAFSVGWQPPVRAGADPLRLTAAVTPGLALAPTGRVPEVAPFSTDAWVSASWAFSSSWTAIGESSLHWFSHATDVPSFVTMTWIQRVGVRWTPHPSWTVLATGAYAGSRSPGAPGPSPGLEVQWRQRRAGAGPAARPAGPGEILIAPVDPGGRGIMLPPPEDVPGARAAEPGPGWIVPFVAGGTLSAGGGDWITRTQPVTVDGPGPWTWRPVLLPREGDATARVTVVDAAGTPISVDTLVLDGVDIGPVAAGSVLELEGVRPGPLDLVATGSLIDGIVVPSIADMDPDRDPLVVALPVGATRVEVDAAEGATLRARSAIEERSVPLDPSGRALFSLEPGRWVLRAEAPGQGAQERTLEVDDGRDTIEIVEFKLKEAAEDGADLVVSVFDADGRPVPDAEVRVGEDAIGRTATGGRLRVEGLDAGVTQLSVAADDFRTQAPARLTLSAEAATEVEVPLSHQAGVVRLEVRSDTGSPLRDVLVRFVGSTLIDPLPLGPDGVLDTVLPAGSWEAVVSAPGFYQQVVDVIVRPERERRL
ncbi:MAG: carboxypeptidase-like regulatory domain-containing protein, partial [Myxococcota bacterium]|nr:carboxypeptidase-like regulatory domain-containing protein [Myxococcota bacterium]